MKYRFCGFCAVLTVLGYAGVDSVHAACATGGAKAQTIRITTGNSSGQRVVRTPQVVSNTVTTSGGASTISVDVRTPDENVVREPRRGSDDCDCEDDCDCDDCKHDEDDDM